MIGLYESIFTASAANAKAVIDTDIRNTIADLVGNGYIEISKGGPYWYKKSPGVIGQTQYRDGVIYIKRPSLYPVVRVNPDEVSKAIPAAQSLYITSNLTSKGPIAGNASGGATLHIDLKNDYDGSNGIRNIYSDYTQYIVFDGVGRDNIISNITATSKAKDAQQKGFKIIGWNTRFVNSFLTAPTIAVCPNCAKSFDKVFSNTDIDCDILWIGYTNAHKNLDKCINDLFDGNDFSDYVENSGSYDPTRIFPNIRLKKNAIKKIGLDRLSSHNKFLTIIIVAMDGNLIVTSNENLLNFESGVGLKSLSYTIPGYPHPLWTYGMDQIDVVKWQNRVFRN